MSRSVTEKVPLAEFAQQIVDDEAMLERYIATRVHWIGDPDPDKRFAGDHPWKHRWHDGNENVYSKNIFSGYSIARRSILHVDKDPWHPDDNPNAFFVGEHNLETGEVSEKLVLRSSVDRSNHLWLQIMDHRDIDNWPKWRHPAYHAPAYEQNRVEIDLTPDYEASEAELRLGLRQSYEFADVVGLDSMIVQILRGRASHDSDDFELAAA